MLASSLSCSQYKDSGRVFVTFAHHLWSPTSKPTSQHRDQSQRGDAATANSQDLDARATWQFTVRLEALAASNAASMKCGADRTSIFSSCRSAQRIS